MTAIKCKIKYTELNDRGEIVSTDIMVPSSIKFYTFDSQFTILEKTQHLYRRATKTVLVQVNGKHMSKINNTVLPDIKKITADNITTIHHYIYDDIFLGQIAASGIADIEIINASILMKDQKLVYKIESDFEQYLSGCVLYYYPMIYTKDFTQALHDARS